MGDTVQGWWETPQVLWPRSIGSLLLAQIPPRASVIHHIDMSDRSVVFEVLAKSEDINGIIS